MKDEYLKVGVLGCHYLENHWACVIYKQQYGIHIPSMESQGLYR